MNDPVAVDVLAVSLAILDGRRDLCSLTRREAVALMGFVLQQNERPERRLTVADPEATILAPALGDAIAAVIGAQQALVDLPANAIAGIDGRLHLAQSISALRTMFEKESLHASGR